MNNKIYVWDLLLRIFHWTLVASFTFSYFSGEEDTIWHIYSGYTILGLLVFRLVWGLVGSRYARFTSFKLSPSAVFAYLGSLFSKKETENYVGHNPAGSWMVIVLLISLSITVFSGLKHYGEEGHGPLAQGEIKSLQVSTQSQLAMTAAVQTLVAQEGQDAAQIQTVPLVAHNDEEHDNEPGEEGDDDEFWEEVHEVFANLTLALVLLHLAGVILSSRKHGENLVRAMVTGYKKK